MKPNIDAYLRSWSDEIGARSNRVRQLIGSAHWLSDGHHKETLLKEFFVRHLPRDLLIGRGFVKSSRNFNRCSPEVDILISDPWINPPLFLEGDLQIVDSSSVVAQIEVKTTFSRSTLEGALLNLSRTQSLIGSLEETQQIWKGVCFFSGGGEDKSLESLLETVESALRAVAEKVDEYSEQVCLIAPNCIATLDDHCCFLSQTGPRNIKAKIFKLGSLGFPCAFADMFSAMRRKNGGPVLGGLDNLIDGIAVQHPLVKDIVI